MPSWGPGHLPAAVWEGGVGRRGWALGLMALLGCPVVLLGSRLSFLSHPPGILPSSLPVTVTEPSQGCLPLPWPLVLALWARLSLRGFFFQQRRPFTPISCRPPRVLRAPEVVEGARSPRPGSKPPLPRWVTAPTLQDLSGLQTPHRACNVGVWHRVGVHSARQS